MRNFALVREILIFLEKNDEKYFNGIMKIAGYSKSEIDYCLQRMLDENLLVGHLLYHFDDVYYHGVALSKEGNLLLETARNEDLWFAVKQKLDRESMPLSAFVGILKRISEDFYKLGWYD